MAATLRIVGLLISEVASIEVVGVVCAVSVNGMIGEVLTAVGADEVVLFEFAGVLVDEASPFVHFMASFFVELFLVKVVLLL